MRRFVRSAYVNVPDAALGDWGSAYYAATSNGGAV
jgi:Berberine and berberine like